MKHLYYLLLALLCITVSACKKNDNSTPTPIDSHISLLTNDTWKINKLEFQTSSGSWITVVIPSTQANETISFFKDNTYFLYVALTTANGSWKFSADYSQLFLVNQSNGGSTWMVNTLTQSILQIQLAGSQVVNGTTYYAERDTFTH